MIAMQDRIGFSFQSILGAIIPFLCAVLCAVLANVPVSMTGGVVPPPVLALMPVYYWCLVRPDLMPPFAVLIIGVLQDLLSGSPPGVWTASFVAAYALVDRERESFAGLSGIGAILGFAAAMLVAGATAYSIMAILYYWGFPPLEPILVEIAVSVIFYIPIAVLLGLVHRHLVGPLRSEL
jgi:rod shape-determining protein MreD